MKLITLLIILTLLIGCNNQPSNPASSTQPTNKAENTEPTSSDTTENNKKIFLLVEKNTIYNEGEYLTKYEYDKNNRLIRESTSEFERVYEYDEKGNLIKESNIHDYHTVYIYDKNNNMIKSQYYYNDELVDETIYEYDDSDSLVYQSFKNEFGEYNEVYYEYDNGKLIKEVFYSNYGVYSTQIYTYNATNDEPIIIESYSEDSLIRIVKKEYSTTNKLIKVTDTGYYEGKVTYINEELYFYDVNDNISEVQFYNEGELSWTDLYHYKEIKK